MSELELFDQSALEKPKENTSLPLELRRLEVHRQRAMGKTKRQIVEYLKQKYPNQLPIKYDEQGVYRDFLAVTKQLAEDTKEEALAYRAQQLEMTDELLSVWYPEALQLSPQALDSVLKLLTHQARLMGLNHPNIVNITQNNVTKSQTINLEQSEDIANKIEHLLKLGAERKAEIVEGEADELS